VLRTDIGMAETRDNGYVNDKLLKKKKKKSSVVAYM